MNYGILEISEDKVEIFLKDINGNILENFRYIKNLNRIFRFRYFP